MDTTNYTNPDPSELLFRTMTTGDANELCDCIRTCYGDTYPAEDFYNPEKIQALLSQGLLHSQIAVNHDNKVIAHIGTLLESNDDITADSITGIVHPAYRGHDVLFRLGDNVVDVYRKLNLIGVQMYVISVHGIIQNQIHSVGGIETGMLLAHFPAGTSMTGFDHAYENSRIVAVLMYVPLHPAPKRVIYIPERYRSIIQNTYTKLGYERSIRDTDSHSINDQTIMSTNKGSSSGVIQVHVQTPGSDLPECIAKLHQQFRLEGLEVMYVDLPLDNPAAALLIEDLRSQGLFYGGIIMERGGTDKLRLQRLINVNIKPDAAVLTDDYGKRLLDFVISDAQDVGAV